MRKFIIIFVLLSMISLGVFTVIKPDKIFPSFVKKDPSDEKTISTRHWNVISGEEYFNHDMQEDFSEDIEDILGEDIDEYGVYIKMLNSKFEYRLNPQKKFFPASIFKILIAKLVLQDIDDEIYDYNTEIELRSEYQLYDSGPLKDEEEGSKYPLDQLLKYMVTHSDNTSWYMIMNGLLEKNDSIDERIASDLKLYNTSRVPFETTPEDIGRILEDIYYCNELEEESCEFLKEIMNSNQMNSRHNDRLVATLPQEAVVYHKIGNWKGVYQDAGIVIGSYNDYIIVVLNRNITSREACEKIGKISRLVWNLGNE